MHEVSAFQRIVKEAESASHGLEGRLKEVQVEIDQFAFIPDEMAQDAWSMATEGSALAGVGMSSKRIPGKIVCGCGYEGSLEACGHQHDFVALCPKCGKQCEMVSGTEVRLVNLVMEKD